MGHELLPDAGGTPRRQALSFEQWQFHCGFTRVLVQLTPGNAHWVCEQ